MKALSKLTKITELQKQICDGALLGDGSYVLHKNAKNAYFSYSSKYLNTVNFIFSLLKSFGGKVHLNKITDRRTGKQYYSAQYKSYSSPLLTTEYLDWYNNKVKQLPKDLRLTPLVCL